MIVKLKAKAEPTIEAFRVNDDNLPALIRRIADVVEVRTFGDDGFSVEWDGFEVFEGEYVVFSGNDVEVLSVEDFAKKYEEVPEPWEYQWDPNVAYSRYGDAYSAADIH